MLYYLIYTSTPTDNVSRKLLEAITAESIQWNKPRGITGILLGMEGRFIQFLEGEEQEVSEVFEKIKKDVRHTNISINIQGYAHDRVFNEWSMGSWMLSNDILTQLPALDDLSKFLNDPNNSNLKTTHIMGMMNNVLKTWIAHESERVRKFSD